MCLGFFAEITEIMKSIVSILQKEDNEWDKTRRVSWEGRWQQGLEFISLGPIVLLLCIFNF